MDWWKIEVKNNELCELCNDYTKCICYYDGEYNNYFCKTCLEQLVKKIGE